MDALFGAGRARALTAALCLLLAAGPSWAGSSAVAAAPAGEVVTVLVAGGSDKLVVQDDSGTTFRVQYIGIRGPTRSTPWHAEALASHAPLVVGQRVVLEVEGKDEEEGYRLRHVYPVDSPTPLGAAAVQAGWVRAVPYPGQHRHRDQYLQLEQQAMADGRGLWRSGLLGPATPWRPAGSAGPGYVAANPDLHPYLDLLTTVPTGRDVVNRLVRAAPAMILSDLEEGLGGFADPLSYVVVLNRGAAAPDQRTLAAIVAHEGVHALDFASEASGLASYSCFETEQRAFTIGAQVWLEFFGPGGKPDPQTDWERAHNALLGVFQRGDLDAAVRNSTGYRAQCAGER